MKTNKLSLVLALVVLLAAVRVTAQETQSLYYNTRGGDSYPTAVLPPVGRDLKLNHHQKRGAYDYFELDLKAGQTLKASLSVGEKGVEIRPDGTTLETGYPYAGLVVYDAAGNQLGILDFNGAERNLQKMIEVDASTPQRIYLLLGSGAGAMNKDYVGFRVDVQDNFDADGLGEAGATIETALTLEEAAPGKTYEKNRLTRNDEADFFKIPTKRGQGVSILVAPDNPQGSISAALYDELRVEMARERSTAPGSALKLDAKADNKAFLYLKVNRELNGGPTGYSIRFVAPPPPVETRPAVETRPMELEPVIPAVERVEKVEKKEAKKDKKFKKKAWWKNPKMLTWGGAAVGGVFVLLLGGLILLRKSKS